MGEPESSTSAGPLSVGDVVADRYRIDEVLGEGGMGIVYRAEHLHLRKPLALKVLLTEWSTMPEVVARFEREAVAAGSIQSPHVAAATDFGRLPGGSFFLVMEYINGSTLRSAIDSGALEPARALGVMRGIVMALQAAHAKGIVHRDLKPENVMLVEHEGDPDFVKVLDFGIAKVGGPGAGNEGGTGKALTQLGAVIGTPEYMSPEQAMGQPVDVRSDLYSAGVIFFEMLSGQRPFRGGAVTVVRQHAFAEVPELPEAFAASVEPRARDILRRLLAKTPEARFASAADLMAALDECTAKPDPVATARPSLPVASALRTLVRYAKQGRVLAALFLLTIVTTMIVGLIIRVGTSARPATDAPPSASAAPPLAPGVLAPSVSSAPAPIEGPTAITVLPPPPTPSSSPATAGGQGPASRPASSKPAPAQSPARRTGPGGIYIPPPSQWFK